MVPGQGIKFQRKNKFFYFGDNTQARGWECRSLSKQERKTGRGQLPGGAATRGQRGQAASGSSGDTGKTCSKPSGCAQCSVRELLLLWGSAQRFFALPRACSCSLPLTAQGGGGTSTALPPTATQPGLVVFQEAALGPSPLACWVRLAPCALACASVAGPVRRVQEGRLRR